MTVIFSDVESPTVTDNALKLPRLFGKYYLLELINVGGMAEVFKAKMFGVEGFEKIVAIKKILPEVAEDGDFIRMFIDEAKIAVQLQHPNIVQILELGKIEDSYFIAMELVNGRDLKTIRKRLKKVELLMPVEQSAHIIAQVCDGLDYAHRKTDEKMNPLNIVHRDISPQNIIVSYEGTVKLIDFGIAKAKSKSTKTQAGMLKGKFSYMSPEQVSAMPLDRRSDIFSLGVVLFEMLTGKRLFLGKNDVETLEKIRKAEVPPPSVFNHDISPELDRIVLRSLARNRDERYQWASEFAEDLKRYVFASQRKFDRQDLMNFMSEFFADELEEDMAKLDEYKKLKMPKNYTPQIVAPSRSPDDDDDDADHVNHSSSSGMNFKKALALIAATIVIGVLSVVGWMVVQEQKNAATLIVDSNVFSTLVNLDANTMQHKRCETPCKLESIMPGQHELELRKDGYVVKRETVTLKAGETQTKVVQMFKVGEQKTFVMVKSEPDGAKIFVNDKDTGELTPALVSAPVGVQIMVRLEKDDYLPVQQSMDPIPANENREVSFIMKHAKGIKLPPSKKEERKEAKVERKKEEQPSEDMKPDRAYLTVITTPATFIYINEKSIQSSPLNKYELPPGEYKIRFKNQTYNIDKTVPVELKAGQHEKIVRNLF